MISMLPCFEYITRSLSLLYLEEIKLIVIVNLIFHLSDFLRLFMISFKYSLILLRYFLTNSVFLLPLLLYSIKLLFQNLPNINNNLLLNAHKDF